MASHIIGNRNSTPETSSSTLRPPSSRTALSAGHHLRASADMAAFSSGPASGRVIRPASEVYYNQQQQGHGSSAQEDSMDKAAQQWIADIDQYENTLEEMAAATLDQDFKDELSAIEQWFRVLTEAERTAALYALLQQTTQVQIRFFIGVLQQMAKSHPMSGVLSPANFGEKDAMSSRLTNAMSRLSVDGPRTAAGYGRPPPTPGAAKRNSGLDQDEINSMFPDAAAAIAKQKADFTQHTGAAPTSNRNSAAIGERSSLVAPTISTPYDDNKKDAFAQPMPSPWAAPRGSDGQTITRPKSSSSQQHQPMGQFGQPTSVSAALRSPRAMPLSGDNNVQSTTLNAPDASLGGMPLLSPYGPSGSWASMVNTPMVSTFSQPQQNNQADIVANATAMKLAALSTVNNRIQLDDVRKYRRSRSSEGRKPAIAQPHAQTARGSALPANFIMTNELGQILTPQQAALLQAQQLAAIGGHRSRPSSPAGLQMQASGAVGIPGTNHANGFLSAYDSNANILGGGLGSLNVGQLGVNSEGYLSDASGIERGRSPRGKRGSSKPPEDPTDIELLKDIPAWLRSLRLHKYTDQLKDVQWTDLVQMDEDALEKRGVNALGARRKMIKVFEQVREAQATGKI